METRTVVITGADSGIGISIAHHFDKPEYRLILTARNAEKLENVRADFKLASSAVTIPADLSDYAQTKSLISSIANITSKIDVFIHAAGVYHDGEKAFYQIQFEQYSPKQILDSQNVGVTSFMILCHAFVQLMPPDGKILAISGAFKTAKGWLPYFASKKALEQFIVGLSQELRGKRIQVNCVSPADTLTPSYQKFFPEYANAEECLEPQDVADLVSFLASPKAQHITGQVIEIRQKLQQ